MNVYDCAIKIEEETKEYYEGLAAESRSPEMKQLFSMLAASEDEHRDSLIRLKATVPPEKATLDGLEGAACRFRPPLTQRELLSETEGDPDLYKFATREGEQEIRLFEELSSRTDDKATARSLRLLIKAERRHLSMIENIYAFFESPRNYLAWGEFSNLQQL